MEWTYGFRFGSGPILTGPGKDGVELSLVRAMRECRGVGDARVYRMTSTGHWTLIVDRAGGDSPRYVASTVHRTLERRARRMGPSTWTLRRMLRDSMVAAHDAGRHVTRDAFWDTACPACRGRAAVLDACRSAA